MEIKEIINKLNSLGHKNIIFRAQNIVTSEHENLKYSWVYENNNLQELRTQKLNK